MKLLDCPFPELLDYEPDIVLVAFVSDNSSQPDDGGMSVYRSKADAKTHIKSLGERIDYSRWMTLDGARLVARSQGFDWIALLDHDGTILRRWDLRGHRGEGS